MRSMEKDYVHVKLLFAAEEQAAQTVLRIYRKGTVLNLLTKYNTYC